MEKLNIVGKRSGDGFVAHKAALVSTLSRALAERVVLMDFTIGRKGFLAYLKALAGSNIVKVVPASVDAGVSQVNGHKKLKVVCGSNTSYLDDLAWVGDKTPMTLCEVRVSPNNTVKPNIGNVELAEALNRVLPFTATDDARPVLNCVNFVAKEGKLKLVSADGFRLAVQSIDFDGEGQALIHRDELAGIANALRKARRVALSFEKSGDSLDGMSLVIDTEAIRYKWRGADGQFPDYEKLIPTEANTTAHFDTVEAGKAIASLKALANAKSYPIDLWLDDSGMLLSDGVGAETTGQVFIPAAVEGKDVKVRLDGSYLAAAMRACGDMVDFSMTDGKSPVLFTTDGYQLVVMPMVTNEASEQAKRDRAEAKPTTTEQAEDTEVTEAVAEAEAITKAEADAEAEKPKRSRKRDKVAIA